MVTGVNRRPAVRASAPILVIALAAAIAVWFGAAARRAPEPVPSQALSVVALGDSVPAGTACDCLGFVSDVAAALSAAAGRPAVTANLAEAGDTTTDVLTALDDPATASAVDRADVVLVQIGANNLDDDLLSDPDCLHASAHCWDDPTAGVSRDLTRILAKVDAHLTRPGARVVVLGYWNVAVAGSVGRAHGSVYVQNSQRATAAINAAIRAAAASSGAVYIDTGAAFDASELSETDLLAADGDHPNQLGHDVLATAVLDGLTGSPGQD